MYSKLICLAFQKNSLFGLDPLFSTTGLKVLDIATAQCPLLSNLVPRHSLLLMSEVLMQLHNQLLQKSLSFGFPCQVMSLPIQSA